MKEPKDYIVFPLDIPGREQAMAYVHALKDHVGLFKVGLELFISEGPGILTAIGEVGGAGIFLDLKLYDIPVTMKRALLSAARYGPKFVTVHCEQGENIFREVAEGNLHGTKILAITLLTSLNRNHLLQLGYRRELTEDLSRMVLLKARMAIEAGCHGVVCSGLEVSALKNELGEDLIAVTPGIRPAWSLVSGDDQRRVVTPADAVRRGADYVVIGRPIRDAKDPADAARRVADEIASAL